MRNKTTTRLVSTLNNKYLSVYFIYILVIYLSACGQNSQLNSQESEQSLPEYNSSVGSSLISRASIVSTPGPVSLLSSMLANSASNHSSFALLNDGVSGEQSYELENLVIDENINATLLNNVAAATYALSLQINMNSVIYGMVPIAQTTEISTTLSAQQIELPGLSTSTLLFPDDDLDGFSNMEELLADTDFQDPQSLPLPGIPDNIAITQNGSDVNIAWNPVKSATNYKVYLALISANTLTDWVVYDASSTSIRINNAVSVDTLDVYAVISAVNSAGEGLSSPQAALNGNNVSLTRDSNSITALVSPILRQYPRPDSVNVRTTSEIKVLYDPLPSITKVWLEVTGLVPVTGRLKESLGKIEFRPDNLDYSTSYTATVTFFEVDANGNTLQSNYDWSFTTGADPSALIDTTPPRVSGLTPAANDVDIRTDSDIRISFSEPVDPLTLNNGVTIDFINQVSTTTSVSGRWGTRTNTAVFTPAAPLPPDTTIWVTVAAVADLAGNQVQSRFGSNFRTAPATTPATAAATFTLNDSYPAADQIDIPVDARLTFDFSQNVDLTALINDAAIQVFDPAGNVVRGSWQGQGQAIVFRPRNNLLGDGAAYIVQMTGAVKSLAGELISGAPIAWVFYTTVATAATDTTAPTLVRFRPRLNAVNIPVTSQFKVTFSEPVDMSSVMNDSQQTGIKIIGPTGVDVAGSWSVNENEIIFTPFSPLEYNSAKYTMIITPDVTDVAGNKLGGRSLVIVVSTENAPVTDNISPNWMGASPGLDETNVSINAEIKIKFDEAIDEASILNHTGVRVHGPSGATIPGRFYTTGNNVEFQPAAPLEYDSQYIIYLTTLTTDLAGNALDLGPGLSEMHWVFFTETQPNTPVNDTTSPTLVRFSPTLNATNIPVTSQFKVTFSEPVDMTSVMNGTKQTGIKIIGPTGADVAGSWSVNGNEIIFTPFSLLEYNNAQYVMIITPDVSDLAGNKLGGRSSIIVVYTENAP